MKTHTGRMLGGILLGTLLVLLLATACAPVVGAPRPANAKGYVDISAAELADLLESQDPLLINVHIPYEGEIPNTDLFIPFDEIGDRTAELPGKDAQIGLYCRSGSMSTEAAETLVGLGYTNVKELDGGMRAWRAAGYRVLSR